MSEKDRVPNAPEWDSEKLIWILWKTLGSLCPLCLGKRFDTETLSVKFKGKSIYDILEMDVGRAFEFFQNIPSIRHKLEVLIKVGLGYLKLGQFSTTLSGGEAQRIKLAKELVRPATGKTLYILDEPTTGLHYHDVKHLLEVLHELVDRGNTVIVIEHNMEVIKTADWIIDLGPEGGAGGGNIVGVGTPEQIAKKKTATGRAACHILNGTLIKEVQKILQKPPARKKNVKGIQHIIVESARQNNLKGVDASIPRGKITICTGPSGSGKSSFAFDTVYAEGQRRYIESLSPYARQFVKQMPKPVLDTITGLSPAISIEQKIHAGNPRSTVGTLTEIYDYLRILFARVGIPHCPETKERIKAISKDYVVDRVMAYPPNIPLYFFAPIGRQEKFSETDLPISAYGISQDSARRRLSTNLRIPRPSPTILNGNMNSFLIVDRLKSGPNIRQRVFEAVETCAKIGGNRLIIQKEEEDIFLISPSLLKALANPTLKSHPIRFPSTPKVACAPIARGSDFNMEQASSSIKRSWTSPLSN